MNLVKRILMSVGYPRQTAPATETNACATVQLSHQVTGEIQDGLPRVQHYGFASATLVGCDHVTVYPEGDRAKGASIASNDQRFRPKGMAAGEVKIYDNANQSIYLQTGSKIVVTGVSEIDFWISGTLIAKITATGLAVNGTITATGDITGDEGSASLVDMINHKHTYTPGTGTPTETSAPVPGT